MNVTIFGITVQFLSYKSLLDRIEDACEKNDQISITYANQYVLNFAFSDKELSHSLHSFDIVYPDGIGSAMAGRLLAGKVPIAERTAGSDLFEMLLPVLQKKQYPVYFFGDTEETLHLVQSRNPQLYIAGHCNGFDFSDDGVISSINESHTKILLVGIGTPKQEAWIAQNKNRLQVPVIMAVGEGIRIFAGNKIRGSKTIQKLGFEWVVRLIRNPSRFWRRYLIGIPLFILRVLKQKIGLL